MNASPSAQRLPCPVAGCLRVSRTVSDYIEHLHRLHPEVENPQPPTVSLLVSDDEGGAGTDEEREEPVVHVSPLNLQRRRGLTRGMQSLPRV